MSLSRSELQHIWRLCSLGINDQEYDKFVWQVDEIIWFVSQLQELDVDWVSPLYHPIEDSNLQMNDWVHNSSFKDSFLKNVDHNIKNDWILIRSAIK